MASRNFNGVFPKMIEASFQATFKEMFKDQQVDQPIKDELRRYFFLGAERITGHVFHLAFHSLKEELILYTQEIEKEFEDFKTEELSLIEKGVELNG